MKKLVVVILCCLCSIRADAGEIKGAKELDKKKLVVGIAALVPAYFAHVVIHEGTHALTAISQGATITDFRFWPSISNDHFYWGLVTANWPGEPSEAKKAIFDIAPQITNVILFSATETLFATGAVPMDSYGAVLLFVFGEAATWLSFTSTAIHSVDIANFETSTGLHPAITRSIGAAISLAGLYFMARRAHKIFWKSKSPPKVSDRFQPSFAASGKEMTVAFKMRF